MMNSGLYGIEETLNRLIFETPSTRLCDLPETIGLYALVDHLGAIRYVGMTITSGFKNRIFSRHSTGSEGRSHKFSNAYNVGRMWRLKNFPGQSPIDAKISKFLRSAFIREFCQAKVLPLDISSQAIAQLESSILSICPSKFKDWNDDRFIGFTDEPKEYVDFLLNKLAFGKMERNAIERQALLFSEYRLRSETSQYRAP